VIYELFYPLKSHYSWLSWLNVLRYIPFRTIMATITGMTTDPSAPRMEGALAPPAAANRPG